jgi:hypothetical protein
MRSFAVTKLSFVAASCSYDLGPTHPKSTTAQAAVAAIPKEGIRIMPESSEGFRPASNRVFNRQMLISRGFCRIFATCSPHLDTLLHAYPDGLTTGLHGS